MLKFLKAAAVCLTLAAFACLNFGPCLGAEPDATTAKNAILQNEILKVEVSPIGGRILSLRDKLRNREEVKTLSYIAGINEVRYQAVINVKDFSTPFELSTGRDAAGNQMVRAVVKVVP